MSSSAPLPPPLPPLIIHLDINKTIIVEDDNVSSGVAGLLSSVLASSAYGAVSPCGRAWALSEAQLLPRAPRAGVISYFTFVREVLHPYAPAGAAGGAARNDAAKAAARALLGGFTAPGAPGAVFAPTLAALLARLALPPGEAAAAAGGGLAGLSAGRRFLLPAYFRLLQHLRHGQRAPWLLVLRTFGGDLASVVAEHNAWAAGAHPCGAALGRGGDAAALRILAERDVATVERRSTDAHAARLLRGAEGGGGELCVGVGAMHALLREAAAGVAAAAAAAGDAGAAGAATPGRVLAWRDAHWRLWFEHGESAAAGKLLPIVPGEASFFLDDNVGCEADTLRLLGEAHVAGLPIATADAASAAAAAASCQHDAGDAKIVDARDVRDGSPLPFAQTRNVHLARVCTLSALLNEDYLVELLQLCQRNLAEKAAAAATGTP